jgi:hypothetical protein
MQCRRRAVAAVAVLQYTAVRRCQPYIQERGRASAVIAKAVNVSPRSVQRAIAIEKKAVPEVRKAVEAGSISLREGERIAPP